MRVWIARDKDNSLWLYTDKPSKHEDEFNPDMLNGFYKISDDFYPEVTWDNSPQELITPIRYSVRHDTNTIKLFGCKNQLPYGGGLILVAANTKEEAYLTAAYDDKTSYLFDWADDDYMWCEPDGNINHCKSDTYPLGEWFEVEHLSANLKEPKVIIEDTYCE